MIKKKKWLDIPVYDLSLDEEDDKGVYMISLVDNPAMETLGVLLSEELESFSDYPDDVKNNAKKVLDWTEKNGWGSCGTQVGKTRANQLANGEPISLETIKRMYSYLSRHQVDLETSKSFSDGCGYLMYMAWGGKSALGWSHNKLKELGLSLSEELANPGKKETEEEFINRCIPIEIKDGTAQDEKQGYAICKSKWDNRNLQSQCNCNDIEETVSVKFSSIKEKKIIVCPVLIPEKLVYRNDIEGKGEGFIKFSAETIQTALKKFNKSNNNTAINFMHQRNKVNGVILESWIIEDPNCDKAKVYGFDLPKGTWMSSIYIEDNDFWENEVKGNELSSFSIEGDFNYKMVKFEKEVSELEILYKAIDKLNIIQILELSKTIGIELGPRSVVRPNLHPNCKCIIVYGKWKLGKSESGPCQICKEAQATYNNKNK